MKPDYHIPEPVLFNPLKHHLGLIREFIDTNSENRSGYSIRLQIKSLKHLGRSVMDIYTGSLAVSEICSEVKEFLKKKDILEREFFINWAGNHPNNFKTITLSDSSQWTIKSHHDNKRYVHIFPSRYSQHTIRAKGNTLKSAILYNILIGKNFISSDDLNKVRAILYLSPIKSSVNAESITKLIEILRN
jgi:hypothetical protein